MITIRQAEYTDEKTGRHMEITMDEYNSELLGKTLYSVQYINYLADCSETEVRKTRKGAEKLFNRMVRDNFPQE